MTIKNYDEVVAALAALLMQFDKDLNSYQTDVYMYYNADDQTATLDTFVNVGGNSWLNDDHYTIYHDKEHYTDRFGDFFQSESEFADALEIPLEELTNRVRRHFEMEDYEKIYFSDYLQYIYDNEALCEKCYNFYVESLQDYEEQYIDNATVILDEFLKVIE